MARARTLRPLVGLAGAERAERGEAFAAWRRLLEARPSSGRSCSSSRTSTGPTTGCSTSSTTSPSWATTVPLLIVATARPELLERRPGWGGGKRNAFTLSLAPLARRRDRAAPPAPARPRRARRRRAAGRARSAPRATRSTPRSTRGCSPSTAASDLPLPETVQGLIAARIDGLARRRRRSLQDASVHRQGLLARRVAARRRATSARAAARARAQGVRPPRPPLLGRRRDAVRVPPRARPRRRLRPDPARASGPRSIAARPSGSGRSPATAPRTTPRCSPTTTGRRSSSPDAAGLDAADYASRRARRLPKARAGAVARRRCRRARARARGARADARGCRSGRSSSSSLPTPAGC